MKILRLDLRAFGPFTDEALDLADGEHGFHVVFGPNEAGKSSALRALRGFFYGIETRSSDNFIHPHPKMRIGATLRAADGQVLQFVRRKGNRNTLRDANDDEPVEETVLAKLLGGVDEASFRRRYGIGYDDLVQGGRDIVTGGGDLGHSLFAAASGIANLNAAQSQLAAEAEKLFLHSARIREINKSVAEYNDLQKQIKDLLLPTARWREHDRALQEAQKHREGVREEIQEKLSRQAELKRVVQAIPLAARRRQLQDELRPLAGVPLLADDFAEQRRSAVTALEVATNAAESQQQEITQLNESLDELQLPADVLQHAEAINGLRERLGSHRKAMDDRRVRVAERNTALSGARAMLKDLGRADLELSDAERLRLTADQRVRIQNLGNEKSKLVERVDNAQANLTKLNERLAAVGRQLQTCPPGRDASLLKAALADARAAGPLEKQLHQLKSEHDAAASDAQLGLSKLRGFSGALADLEQLALPAEETVDRFEREIAERTQSLQAMRRKLAETQDEAHALDEQIERLRRAQDVPTEADLAAARQLRNRGWELLRVAWDSQPGQSQPADEATAEFVNQFAGAEDLPQAYAEAVAQADHLADRLRREATQVAEKAQLLARRETLVRRLEALQDEAKDSQRLCDETQQNWLEVWRPSGIDPLSPREMHAWLRQAEGVCAAAKLSRSRLREIEQLESELAHHRQTVSAALNAIGQPPPGDDVSWADVLRGGDAALAAVEEENRCRAKLVEDEQQLKCDVEKGRRAVENSAQELAVWADQWAAATAPMKLRDDAEPAEANAAVESTKALLDHITLADSLEHRIRGIDRDAEAFGAEVQSICASASSQLAQKSVEQAVAQLCDLLSAAQAIETRRSHLQKQLAAAQEKCDAAAHDRQQAAALLRAMCTEAGCDQPEELPSAEQNAQRKKELQRDLREFEQRLADLASGRSMEEFIDSLTQFDAQQAAGELNKLSEEVEQLRQQESTLGETIGEQRTALAQMDGNSKASECRQHAEQLLAKIRGDAEQYARLHLASVVLQRAIERYRQQHQGPVLQQASDLFATLTLGRFESLRADLDDSGAPILVGVRSGNSEAVHVDGMSEGTCDQLYMALRLASLTNDLASREPLPFVVDDVLIKFDDDRAAAALKALAALSEKTQVIMFTHHEHIVRLAKETLDDDVLFTHQLDSRQSALAETSTV